MKRLVTIFCVVGVAAACGTRPEATLDATVTGIADGTTVWLLDNARAKVDSTTVAGGKFRFDIAKAELDIAFIEVDCPTPGPLSFFVEPGMITGELVFETAPPAPPKGFFAGTPSNDAQKALDEGAEVYTKTMSELVPQLNALQRDTPEYEALLNEYYKVNDEAEQYRQDAVTKNPNTVFAAYHLYRGAHAQTTPAEVDSLLNIISGAPANAFTDRLKERRDILAKTAVGVEAPDFSQAQPDGTPLALSSLRGKLVLIDFWASWCGPCRRENPNVVKLYDRFKDKGFEILGVSLDDDRDNWLKAIEDDGLTWKHVSDVKGWKNVVAEQYAVKSIPHTVLVGADGVILAKNLRGAVLEAKVAELLE